jgi:hypothetical protein
MLRLSLRLMSFLAILAPLAFGQGANGTITGTVTDPTGSVIAAAAVAATNAETGAVYSGASTAAGNYTIPNLPVGTYSLTVKVSGFKTYTHANLALAATQVLREDIALQVGAASESVTVTAEASLLKTETGEQAHAGATGRHAYSGYRGGQLGPERLPESLQLAGDLAGRHQLFRHQLNHDGQRPW